MLKSILVVTLIVNHLAAVEGPYTRELGYTAVHRGTVPAAQASLWGAGNLRDHAFVVLEPASGKPVYLRFIEDPAASPPAAGTTWGWNAIENVVEDPDALARQFAGTAFKVIRVIPSGMDIPISPAASPVDRVFIMVVGGPSMTALQAFYRDRLGLPVTRASEWPITTLSRALDLPLDTKYPLALAPLPREFQVELDQYPAQAVARPVPAGSAPAGIAMVSFIVDKLDDVRADWRAPPRPIAEFPYSGRKAGVTVGPAGEWLELVEGSLPAR
ncbi:MAG: hypothetical protein DYH20_01225 [Gammaproteobacteria bacterium PRO9]|nr:hypothetical protein [Gammaproteobacteria bacterium PRO9]